MRHFTILLRDTIRRMDGARTVSLQCAGLELRIEVADICGNANGPTLLITGGMDGDEYAGMEAAHRLITKYRAAAFRGRIIIVPVVNIPGFNAGVSANPIDGKYPKRVFPGKPDGTATDALMHWLSRTYVREASAWLDLHGGASDEYLVPFMWGFKTGAPTADSVTKKFLDACGAERAVWDSHPTREKKELARNGTAYLLAESGQAGERDAEDIARHIAWAEMLANVLGMTDGTMQSSETSPRTYRKVAEAAAARDGMFFPSVSAGDDVRRGALLGTFEEIGTLRRTESRSPRSGTVFWIKKSGPVRKNDTIAGIAHEQA